MPCADDEFILSRSSRGLGLIGAILVQVTYNLREEDINHMRNNSTYAGNTDTTTLSNSAGAAVPPNQIVHLLGGRRHRKPRFAPQGFCVG